MLIVGNAEALGAHTTANMRNDQSAAKFGITIFIKGSLFALYRAAKPRRELNKKITTNHRSFRALLREKMDPGENFLSTKPYLLNNLSTEIENKYSEVSTFIAGKENTCRKLYHSNIFEEEYLVSEIISTEYQRTTQEILEKVDDFIQSATKAFEAWKQQANANGTQSQNKKLLLQHYQNTLEQLTKWYNAFKEPVDEKIAYQQRVNTWSNKLLSLVPVFTTGLCAGYHCYQLRKVPWRTSETHRYVWPTMIKPTIKNLGVMLVTTWLAGRHIAIN